MYQKFIHFIFFSVNVHTYSSDQSAKRRKEGNVWKRTRTLSSQFTRYFVFSNRKQRRVLYCYHSEKMRIVHSSMQESNPPPSRLQSDAALRRPFITKQIINFKYIFNYADYSSLLNFLNLQNAEIFLVNNSQYI